MASPVETQQAFLEGHALAFDWFGGVFGEVRYDNLGSAVKKVLRGRRRVETDRFVAMRSHYLFDSIFTTPGDRGRAREGWRGGRGRPVPPQPPGPGPERRIDRAAQPAARRGDCEQDLGRRIAGRPVTVAEQLAVERPLLRALPAPFDATETTTVRVDAKALVTVRQNRYSVPVALAGLRVSVAIGATEIRVMHRDREVARHERLHGKYGTRATLDHYLELLARKPGALARSLPLAQERDRGNWPATFDELWAALRARWGESEADKQMVDVLMLCREHGPATVELAVRGVLAAGAIDGRAVGVLARRTGPARRRPGSTGSTPGSLRTTGPSPTSAGYDQLIGGAR